MATVWDKNTSLSKQSLYERAKRRIDTAYLVEEYNKSELLGLEYIIDNSKGEIHYLACLLYDGFAHYFYDYPKTSYAAEEFKDIEDFIIKFKTFFCNFGLTFDKRMAKIEERDYEYD